jgi:RNA polymerase sigma-70 factor, ECF subfamily
MYPNQCAPYILGRHALTAHTPSWRALTSAGHKKRSGSRHNEWVNRFSALEAQAISPPESEEVCLQSLISGMALGQADAMAQLYDTSIGRVYSLVRRFLPDDASAQDVTQEVYLQAWQQASRYNAQRGAAMGWLLNIARSRALDAWRKLSSNPVLANSDLAAEYAAHWLHIQQPADFLEAADTQSLLHTALQQLPATTRQMLSLAFFHDMTHAEISTHLHMPLGTVKSTLRRALLALREPLQQSGLSYEHLATAPLEDTP